MFLAWKYIPVPWYWYDGWEGNNNAAQQNKTKGDLKAYCWHSSSTIKRAKVSAFPIKMV